MTRGELHKAPLKNPERALDLGTGTGLWAIEFGDQYPNCTVIGTDLSPIQPHWVPPNVEYIVDDFEESEWAFDMQFDYIHGRTLSGSVSDWAKLIKTAYDNLAPGGWLEFQETDLLHPRSDDGTYDPSGPYGRYNSLLRTASSLSPRPFLSADKLKPLLLEAGFECVNQSVFKAPVGPWAKAPRMKELGIMGAQILSTGLEAYALASFTRYLGMSAEESREVIAAAFADICSRRHHVYFTK